MVAHQSELSPYSLLEPADLAYLGSYTSSSDFNDPTPSTSVPRSWTETERTGASHTYTPLFEGNVHHVAWEDFLNSTTLNALCPGADCLQACQNYSRIFESAPASGAFNEPGTVTLFGLCSHLGILYEKINDHNNQELSKWSGFFPYNNQTKVTVNQISVGLSSCLVASCEKSNDPRICRHGCSLDQTQSGDGTMDLHHAGRCFAAICEECGLPYANEDIYGVGILVAYVMQALMVLALALVQLSVAVWCDARQKRRPLEKVQWKPLGRHFQRFIKDFLGAQCYFGIFLQAAALWSSPPDTIDPLNGYALVSVAMTGFLPTTFTLVLLQYNQIHSWFHTGLTFVSWLLASTVFFKVEAHLYGVEITEEYEDAGLRRLYSLPSCGNSTALVLCNEMVNVSPLEPLSHYYNPQSSLTGRSSSISAWAWSTICLVAVVTAQLVRKYRSDRGIVAPKARTGIRRLSGILLRAVSHWAVLFVVSAIFGLSLGYQAVMVQNYTKLNVVDWNNWTYGQILAMTVWIPPILNHLREAVIRRSASK